MNAAARRRTWTREQCLDALEAIEAELERVAAGQTPAHTRPHIAVLPALDLCRRDPPTKAARAGPIYGGTARATVEEP